jgi:hypothetical protein
VTFMSDNVWTCPAIESEIEEGLCWEYCYAEIGGPIDTAHALRTWIKKTGKVNDIEDFHKVCENCTHCRWSK